MTLRINARRGNRADYLLRLNAAGIAATEGDLSPQAIYLESARDVLELPGFATGDASVQDEAAQMAALLLAAQPGERVLDACAAPGGKSCHILELQPALGELTAMDLDPQRLERVQQNLERLGLQASLIAGDGANPPPVLAAQSFDKVLVDAPCSASGVIRRHPDVKSLRRQNDIASLGAQQTAILQGLWPLLKPGGRLLYATCSILDGENNSVVNSFLKATDDAILVQPELTWGVTAGVGRQLLPNISGPDGLFYALIEKRRLL